MSLDEILKGFQVCLLEGKYNEIYNLYIKHQEQLNKNMNAFEGFLSTLDIHSHSIIYLLYLNLKFKSQNINPAYFENLYYFIDNFDIEQIKVAKDLYAEIFHNYTQYLIKNNTSYTGIEYLPKAIRKIQSSLSLTSIHSDLLHICLASRVLKPSLEFLDTDITMIENENNKWNAKYLLLYFYYGGIIYCAYKNFSRAFYFFETGMTIPTSHLSKIMVEMYKKYVLLSLIAANQVGNLPKYTSNFVMRIVKPLCQAYTDFANVYTKKESNLNDLINKIAQYSELFTHDGNMGLIKRCKKNFLQNRIKKISKIYLTISVKELTRILGLSQEETTLKILKEMVSNKCINLSFENNETYIAFYDDEVYSNVPSIIIEDNCGNMAFIDIEKKTEKCLGLHNQLKDLNERISTDPKYLQKLMGMDNDTILPPVGTSKPLSHLSATNLN